MHRFHICAQISSHYGYILHAYILYMLSQEYAKLCCTVQQCASYYAGNQDTGQSSSALVFNFPASVDFILTSRLPPVGLQRKYVCKQQVQCKQEDVQEWHCHIQSKLISGTALQ